MHRIRRNQTIQQRITLKRITRKRIIRGSRIIPTTIRNNAKRRFLKTANTKQQIIQPKPKNVAIGVQHQDQIISVVTRPNILARPERLINLENDHHQIPTLYNNIFIISIRPARADSMMKRLGNWKTGATVLQGTHWRNINVNQWKHQGLVRSLKFGNRKKLMSRGELGCYHSHFRVWQQIVARNIPYALILEDDAEINMIHAGRLAQLSKTLESQSNWDVVVLYTIQAPKNVSKQSNIMPTSLRATNHVTGLAGYIVTLEGAKRLMQGSFPITCPVDIYVPNLSARGRLRLLVANPPMGGQMNRKDSDTSKG